MLSARKGAETLGLESRNSLSRSLWLSYPWWPSEVCPWLLWVSSLVAVIILLSLCLFCSWGVIYIVIQRRPLSLWLGFLVLPLKYSDPCFCTTRTWVSIMIFLGRSALLQFIILNVSRALGTSMGTWVKSRLTRFTSVDICFIKQEKGLGNGSSGKVSVLQTWGVELEAQNTHKNARFDDIHLSSQC